MSLFHGHLCKMRLFCWMHFHIKQCFYSLLSLQVWSVFSFIRGVGWILNTMFEAVIAYMFLCPLFTLYLTLQHKVSLKFLCEPYAYSARICALNVSAVVSLSTRWQHLPRTLFHKRIRQSRTTNYWEDKNKMAALTSAYVKGLKDQRNCSLNEDIFNAYNF